MHEIKIADVALHEGQARVVANDVEVRDIAGVGQLVQHGHCRIDIAVNATEDITHVFGADESGSTRDEDFHGFGF
ncbi:hypothetical protein GCM10028775_06040 [Catellatospora paridis]